MKIIEKDLQLHLPAIPSDSLFLDIETTGLSAERSHLYLYGCIHRMPSGVWHFRQWLLESPFEEREALRDIDAYTGRFSRLIHFNGDRFDLPYLDIRSSEAGLDTCFLKKDSLDLYKELRRCRDMFRLPNARQKSFEIFAGIDREDKYDGGQLIEVYHRYCMTDDPGLLQLLLLHNEEDVIYMTSLISLLPYAELKAGNCPEITSVQAGGSSRDDELIVTCGTDSYYPKSVSVSCSGIYLVADRNSFRLHIPLYSGELKYFFPHVRDYYYLPAEDTAVHKSVASFVDPAYRVRATRENCYVRREGNYFMLPSDELLPEVFRSGPDDDPYGQLSQDILADNAFWQAYIGAVMSRS